MSAAFQIPFISAHIPEAAYFFYKVALSTLEPTVRLLIYHGVCVEVATTYLGGPNGTYFNVSESMPCRATLEPYPALEDRVQVEAADYMILSKILMNVPAIMLGFVCGGWSDVVGRRMPMFLTCAGSCVAVIFYIISLVVGGAAIPFVLLATLVHSLFGRNSVITMSVHSSVTDLSTKEDRTKRLGRLLAMNFLGQFCGSLLLGFLLDRVTFLTILIIVFFLFALCSFFVALFLPETVPNASPLLSNPLNLFQSSKELCRLHHIRDSALVVAKPRPNNLRLYLIICLVCLCANQTCKAGEVDVTLLFVRHRPLEWEKSEYGYLLAVNFAAIGLSLMFILPFLSGRLAIRDTTIIIGVVCFKIVRLTVMAFARQSWMVYFSVLLDSPIGMVISCTKSIISKIVDESETGKAFAIQASIETGSGMLGSMIFNSLYDLSFRYFLGTTFLAECAIYFVLLGIAIWMWKTLDGHYKSDYGRFNADGEETAMLRTNEGDGLTEQETLAVNNPNAMSDAAGNGQVVRQASNKFSDYGGTAPGSYQANEYQPQQQETSMAPPISWSSNYQQPTIERMQSLPAPGPGGVMASIRTQYGGQKVPATREVSEPITSIEAPPTSRRAGEPPPASIARPRPAPTRRQQQGPDNDHNSSDQFGALSQYR